LANLRVFYSTQIEELPMDLSKIYEWSSKVNHQNLKKDIKNFLLIIEYTKLIIKRLVYESNGKIVEMDRQLYQFLEKTFRSA
jgi:hypothetical protein